MILSMKKVLEPAKTEKVVYYSDFNGKLFEYVTPEVEITFEFNYGSDRDGLGYTLHLTDKEYKELEAFLSKKLLPEVKKEIKIK